MTTALSETGKPSGSIPHCGCCGRAKPAGQLTELGSTPGVYICANCAVWASLRTKGIRLERLHPRLLVDRFRRRSEPRGGVAVAIPILPSSDLSRTAVLYASLGFDVVERLNDYMVLNVGRTELHFTEDPELPPGLVFLNVPETGALWKRLKSEGIAGLGPLEDQPWGIREFLLTDPDGNRIRIGHPIGD